MVFAVVSEVEEVDRRSDRIDFSAKVHAVLDCFVECVSELVSDMLGIIEVVHTGTAQSNTFLLAL